MCNFFLSVSFIVSVKVGIFTLNMRDIIIYVAWWWEKYLSKRSPLKQTLVCLHTRDIAENIVCDTINKIELVEIEKSQEFFTERLVKKTKSIDDTLHKNKLSLFSYKPPL